MGIPNSQSRTTSVRRSYARWSVKAVGGLIGALLLASNGWAAVRLPSYNIDLNQSSISGVSAGGYMAGQFHVAYSKIIKGVGILAGGPYNCAQGSLAQATTQAGGTNGRCMENPQLLSTAFIQQLYQDAKTLEGQNKVDPLTNMKDDKVVIVHGSLDITVKPGVGNTIKPWYILAGLPTSNIKEIKGQWGHAHITDNWGNPCNFDTEPPWISNCGIDASGQILEFIYGPLNPRTSKTSLSGRFIEFDQSEFVNPTPNSMQPNGVVYVPKACDEGAECRLHVYFHGCEQNYDSKPADRYGDNAAYDCKGVFPCPYPVMGDTMWKNAGLNEWADTNNMIVLYPQAKKSYSPYNPKGCWDWWGYINTAGNYDYASKSGPQMKAVYDMMTRLSSGFSGDGDGDGDTDGDGDGDGDAECPVVSGNVEKLLGMGLVVTDPIGGLTYYKTSGDGQRVWSYVSSYDVYAGGDGLGYMTDPKNCASEIVTYDVTTYAGQGGSISPTSRKVEENQLTTFTVTANANYQIASVTGCDGALNGSVYTTSPIRQDCLVTALFTPVEPQKYTVTASAGANGSVSPTSQQVNSGAAATVTVTPATNYEINTVTGCGGTLSGNVFTTAAVTANCQISATFKAKAEVKYVVTATASTGGAVSPTTQQVVSGQTGTVTVTPNSGYSIESVSGCGGSRNGNVFTTAPVTANCTVLATFSKDQPVTYTVTAVAGQGGTVAPASQQINAGQSAQISISPNAGYEIETVTSGCGGARSGNTFTTGAVNANCEVLAVFRTITVTKYVVTATATAGGSITPATQQVTSGQKATVTMTAEAGYQLSTVNSGCGGTRSGNSFTTGAVTANCEVQAVFSPLAPTKYTVTAVAGTGGSVTPATQQVTSGSSATVVVTANAGYAIASATGCGGALNANLYIIPQVTANCSVDVSFIADDVPTYTVAATVGDGGTVSPASQLVAEGGSAVITVFPITGYVVESIEGCPGGSLVGNTYTVANVTQSCAITVTFEPEVAPPADPGGGSLGLWVILSGVLIALRRRYLR